MCKIHVIDILSSILTIFVPAPEIIPSRSPLDILANYKYINYDRNLLPPEVSFVT